MIRPGETHLLDVNVGGTPWKLVESDGKIQKELRGEQGLCKPNRHVMYINREETPPEGREYVGVHEIGHAVVFTTGGREGLKQITGLDDDKLYALEEYIVCVLFHSMWDTYKRNNWLTIPINVTDP